MWYVKFTGSLASNPKNSFYHKMGSCCYSFVFQRIPDNVVSSCKGAAGICLHLYDTAPSGRLGTMSYMCRALAKTLNINDNQDNVECAVS